MAIASTSAYKVVLLGHTGVGKTSMALRFTQNEFLECQLSTIGAQCITKTVKLPDRNVNFAIWDTAGQERFHSLAPIYYRNAKAAIIVYDITQQETINIAKDWILEMKSQPNDIIIILVGNKSDLSEQREIKRKEAQKLADQYQILFLETSARTGEYIQELFFRIAELMPKNSNQETNEKKEIIPLSNKNTKIDKKSNCC
ncbi:ras-related protein rab-5c [Anaeramoeba ignava]|uniref:Ras-related protein rab-5c n=1 Tax=Anaeramoeba ignava TaxID=1746090 RepID=A0A9Q0LBF1_ANAIG|nr:ras-related protein rab-5c [Anaeramoeba ignava]